MSTEIIAAEYRPRDPEELRDFSESTYPNQTETYWRCGYLIEGGKPQMVDEFMRNEQAAGDRAKNAASEVRATLLKIGAPSRVSWWTQRWVSKRVTEYDDAHRDWV